MSNQPSTAVLRPTGEEARARLLSGLPVTERYLEPAGIPTALLEGGAGSPVVLLHGPGGNATHWLRVIPHLTPMHRVLVPDLPGQGPLEFAGTLDAQLVIDWLGELIDRTCTSPPTLVGYAFGATIAARFASNHSDRLARLVMIDALGLQQFQPAPEFGAALHAYIADPTEATHDLLWEQCTLRIESLRAQMPEGWDAFRAYNLDRARTPSVMAALGRLFEIFAFPAIPPEELQRITVPTILIWGQNDTATPVDVAQTANRRFGWPLRILEGCGGDPPVEEPEALVRAITGQND